MLIGYNWSDAFTMGIEVALRNGNLAIALAATLFPASRPDDPDWPRGFLHDAVLCGRIACAGHDFGGLAAVSTVRLPHQAE